MTAEFGQQCLMARRLVERGVRFVQLYSGGKKGSEVGWGRAQPSAKQNHEFMAKKVDKTDCGAAGGFEEPRVAGIDRCALGRRLRAHAVYRCGPEGGQRQSQ